MARTPIEVVEASYEHISFPPGSTPDWNLFGELFVESAVLGLRVFPEDPQVRVMSLREYADYQMREGLEKEGYSETPGKRTTDTVGDVSVVRQEFTMQFTGRAAVLAVDIFSLVRTAEGWRIVSVVSDFAPSTTT